MERLTQSEWQAVLAGLEMNAANAWREAASAYGCGMPRQGDWWTQRVIDSKRAYDHLFMWPWEPEESRHDGFADDDWRNGETYHIEPIAFYTEE